MFAPLYSEPIRECLREQLGHMVGMYVFRQDNTFLTFAIFVE